MSEHRRGSRGSFSSDGSGAAAAIQPKVGHLTQVARSYAPVQRKPAEGASAATTTSPDLGAAEPAGPPPSQRAWNDLFELHAGGARSDASTDVVQRKETDGAVDRSVTREAASIDAPAADSIDEERSTLPLSAAPSSGGGSAVAGAKPALSHAQLEHARRRNPHQQHKLRFDPAAFGGGAVDSADFAVAVARFQAAHGLRVDGIAGHDTCRAAGCLPAQPAAPSSAVGAAAGDPADRGATRAPASIDAPAADSIDEERSTLPVQALSTASRDVSDADTHAIAAAGVSGSGGAMPFAATLKDGFGPDHAATIDGISAHVGGPAASAASAIGARAYATGGSIAFASSPDLHTAAHEAAHVFQQRAGSVQLKGGVGAAGDPYEQHADAVADAVVRGDSAAPLLGAPHSLAASTPLLQKRSAADVDATSGMLVGDRGTESDAVIALTQAAADAKNVAALNASGTLSADAGCLELAVYVGRALPRLRLLASQSKSGLDAGRVLSLLDQVVGPSLHLLQRVGRGSVGGSRTPQLGAPALRDILEQLMSSASAFGYQRPATVVDADDRANPPDACPTGAAAQHLPHCTLPDPEREHIRQQVINGLVLDLNDFFLACSEHQDEIREAIERDEKSREALLDGLVTAVTIVSFGAGALADVSAAQGAATAAHDVASASHDVAAAGHAASVAGATAHLGHESKSMETAREQLVDLLKQGVSGALSTSGDERARTVAMLDGLKSSANQAVRDVVFSRIQTLNDDELQAVFIRVSGRDAQSSIRTRVSALVEKFEHQVQPLGRDYLEAPQGMSAALGVIVPAPVAMTRVRTVAAYLTGPDGQQRLAVVNVRRLAINVAAEHALETFNRGPDGDVLDPKTEIEQAISDPKTEVEFVTWIDATFAGAAEATAPIDLTFARIDRGRRKAIRTYVADEDTDDQ